MTATSGQTAALLDTGSLLLALLPALGPRAALADARAVLKWAGADALAVQRSALDFFGADGRHLACHPRAFGLGEGSTIEPPAWRWLVDERRPPAGAVRQRWQLDGACVEAALADAEAGTGALALTCLPLQLPLEDDVQFIVGIVNTGEQVLDVARGVREACCRVDGMAWASTAGGVWNGPYQLLPGHATTRRFRLADFPGAPTHGKHDIVFEMLGRASAPLTVHWHGVPWTQEAAA